MKDFIKGLKLLTYGLQYKTMIILFAIFVAFGIMFEIGNLDMGSMGGIYLILTGSYIYQMTITSTVSSYICSSSLKKKLQTSIPAALSLIMTIFMYAVFVAIRSIRVYNSNMTSEEMNAEFAAVLVVAALAFLIMIYNSVAYKFYIPALIGMLIFMIPLMILGMRSMGGDMLPHFANNWMYVIIGLVIIVCGSLVSYVISLLVYKKELDPKTYKSALTRAGK